MEILLEFTGNPMKILLEFNGNSIEILLEYHQIRRFSPVK